VAEAFFDTNVLLYLLSREAEKAERAEVLLASGGVISVQVLTEFASVARRKLGMAFAEIREILTTIRALLRVAPVDTETHDLALDLAERYGFAFHDALIVAAASRADCAVLYTEDLQPGQKIGPLTVRSPFHG
jgi:predicted nucleic acid-binding protein